MIWATRPEMLVRLALQRPPSAPSAALEYSWLAQFTRMPSPSPSDSS